MVAERALGILQLLIEHPMSMDALIDGISQDLKFEWRSYSKETIYRDLKRLRNAGFKIDYVKKIGAYQLKESPVSIQFSPGEFIALVGVCRSLPPEASASHVKVLAGVLDSVSNLISPDSKEHLTYNPHFQMKLKPVIDYTSHQDAITITRQAIADGKQIEIVYYSATSDMKQKRVVDPYELYFTEGGVTLEGFCHANQRLMEFRVDRIRHIEMLPTLIDNAVAENERLSFKLWLDGELTESIGNQFSDQEIELNDDGTSILTAKSTNSFRLLLKVLSYGEHAKILAPESLKKEMIAIAGRMVESYKG